MALHARAFTRVAFDPFITRGEDLDYLFNMRMFGYDVWFDNEWTVRHLPPESEKRSPRFMQDVYRWYYERAKLTFAAHQKELIPVTAASLMPYPARGFRASSTTACARPLWSAACLPASMRLPAHLAPWYRRGKGLCAPKRCKLPAFPELLAQDYGRALA